MSRCVLPIVSSILFSHRSLREKLPAVKMSIRCNRLYLPIHYQLDKHCAKENSKSCPTPQPTTLLTAALLFGKHVSLSFLPTAYLHSISPFSHLYFTSIFSHIQSSYYTSPPHSTFLLSHLYSISLCSADTGRGWTRVCHKTAPHKQLLLCPLLLYLYLR